MPESGLGAQAALALGGRIGFAHASDLEPSDRWYETNTDLVELSMDADGTMAVPNAPPAIRLERRATLVLEVG